MNNSADRKNPIGVIYVTGSGRSGSTLLDIILGSHPDVFGAGELWAALAADETKTGTCSCGRRFLACPLWAQILADFAARIAPRTLSDAHATRVRNDNARRLPGHLLGMQEVEPEYVSDTLSLFSAIAHTTGKSIIIDSTKQVGRAYNLLENSELNVRLLHLVRDGRAVTWSRQRDRNRGESFGWWARQPIFNTVKWTTQNILAEVVSYSAGDRYLRIRYEDLMTNPRDVLRKIQGWADLKPTGLLHALESAEGFAPGHQIGGNKRARAPESIKRLRLDESWKTQLPKSSRAVFWCSAGWYAKRFGYTRD